MKSQNIDIVYKDITMNVMFIHYPPEVSSKDSLGVPEQPEAEGYIEVEQVFLCNKDITELLDKTELKGIADKINEYLYYDTLKEN